MADNFLWLLLDKAVRLSAGFVASVMVARHLGPDQFGVLNFALVFVGMFASISALGLASVAVRDLVQRPEIEIETLSAAFYLQLVSRSLVIVIALITIGHVVPAEQSPVLLAQLVALFAIAQLCRVSDVFRYAFEARVASKVLVKAEALIIVFGAIAKVWLAASGADIRWFAGIVLLEALVVLVVFFTLGRTHLHVVPRLSLEVANRARSLIATSWPMIFSGAALLIFIKIDILMLTTLHSAEQAGVYAAAIRISELWYAIPAIVVSTIYPTMAKQRVDPNARSVFQANMLSGLVFLSVSSLIFAACIALFSSGLMLLLFGQAFALAGDVLAIHVWAGVFIAIGYLGARWYLIEGLQHLNIYRNCIAAIVNVSLNWVLIPTHGAIGAAIATVVSYACATYLFDAFSERTRPMFVAKSKAVFVVPALAELIRYHRRRMATG